MEESKIEKILRKILIDDIKEECIDYINDSAIEDIILFLTTGERRHNKFVECIGGYDEIRRLSQYV